jgi:hypothetical protein
VSAAADVDPYGILRLVLLLLSSRLAARKVVMRAILTRRAGFLFVKSLVIMMRLRLSQPSELLSRLTHIEGAELPMSATKHITLLAAEPCHRNTRLSPRIRILRTTVKAMLVGSLLLAIGVLPAGAGDGNRQDHRDDRNNQTFNKGLRNGGRNGQYNDPRYDNRQYNNSGQYNNGYPNQGGIGPGKGALIGGAGGAVLGAVFGGGLKGTLIGGAAGAGIGAVVGEVHRNNQQNQYYPR